MQIWSMLLIVVFSLSFALAVSVVLYYSYRQVRKKGYRPPGAAVILLAGCSIGIAGATALSFENTTNSALFLWRFFWVPFLLSTGVLGFILLILPHRVSRVFGERKVRFPFKWVGVSLIIMGVVLVPLIGGMCFQGSADLSHVLKALSLAIMLSAAGMYLIRRAKTIHMPPLEEILLNDPRPPVLYLRAFNQESQFFIMGTKGKYGAWGKSLHAAVASDHQNIGITVEEYLSEEVTSSIGPFVALGSPEDYLAPPGALRMYAKDDDWKVHFDELARRSACVIVELSKSDNLCWELEHLRSEGLQEKLFVLTRPATEASWLSWAFWGLLWRLKGIRSMTWSEFQADLAKLGYEIDFADPGPGAVLGFDSSGKGFILATEAIWPEEFVLPIQESIQSPTISGVK